MSSELRRVAPDEGAQPHEAADEVQPGQWWWYHHRGLPGRDVAVEDEEADEDEEDVSTPVLVCVMHLGSNYVLVKTPRGREWRQKPEVWFDYFAPADDAEPYIASRQSECQQEVERLMEEIHEITRRLGVSSQATLSAEQSTQALVTRQSESTYDEYKSALVKAERHTIPDLYYEMRRANERLRDWLLAPTLPMTVGVVNQKEIIQTIQRRVFNVELYAGLCEEVHQITDGEPAPFHEKLHLMQRRHYMDEECLAAYETGGMSFGDMREFHAWLAQSKNRDRIFPFSRCMVAFQVRRHDKQFAGHTLRQFIEFRNETEHDKSTFLYIRNGERMYCLETKVEFGERLFPDLDHSVFASGQLVYAKKGYREWSFITEGEYLERQAQHAVAMQEWEVEHAEWEVAYAKWDALSREEKDAHPERWVSFSGPYKPSDQSHGFEPFTPDNLYHDDIVEHLQEQAEKYNRISLIIQGLFDRSDILHPHPKVRTWTTEGFEAAIELHYDASQALVSGPAPDFEAYRARLNETLGAGVRTVGQARAYAKHLAAKEERTYYNHFSDGYGVAVIAPITEWKPRARKAVFRWTERTWPSAQHPTKPRRFEVKADRLFNVDAYTPGDFKQFYEDPRTRADYLQWAYYLLLAEEFHAGNVDERGRPCTKATAHVCEICGETWYRSHTCRAGTDHEEEIEEVEDDGGVF